jgi:hypothetical protein
VADFEQSNPVKEIRIVSVHQGASNRDTAYLIEDTQAVELENLVINTIGKRERRGGVRAFGGRTENPGGIGPFNEVDQTEKIAAVWGSSLYESRGNGGWAQIASNCSLTDDKLHDFARVRIAGELGFAAVTAVQTTEPSDLVVYNIVQDNATCFSLGARCQSSFQERLWFGSEEVLYWSELTLPADFSLATNNLTIEPGVGGELTAIVPARDNSPKMWLFKQRAVFLFEPRWGSSSAQIPSAADALDTVSSNIRLLTQGAGCLATKSAQWVPGEQGADLFFLAEDGVRSLARAENDTQAGAGFPVSYNIKAWIDRINWTHAHKAAATVYDNAYHLAVPLDGATENTHVLRFDIANRAWSLHTWSSRDVGVFSLGGQARYFFQNNDTAGDSSVTGPSADALYQVYQGFTGNADPSLAHIRVLEQSKGLVFDELTRKKTWEDVSLVVGAAETASYIVQYRVDFGAWVDLESDTIPGSDQSIVLGEDALPWRYSDTTQRRRVYGLRDAPPGYVFEYRLAGATAVTDLGKLAIYNTEVRASVNEKRFEDEN